MAKITRTVIAPVLVLMLIFGVALVFTFADGPALSGITVTDEHPNGCIDCHNKSGDNDYRLNVSLKESGHTDITSMVKTVPEGCAMCHREGSGAGPLNLQTHRVHYQNASENHFVTSYGGECLACHALNPADGVMKVKNAPSNW